jgi:Icc protein
MQVAQDGAYTAGMAEHKRRIEHAELFGVTDDSATLCFEVRDGDQIVDAEAIVRMDDSARATSWGSAGTRLVRVEGLTPGTEYTLSIEAEGGAFAEHGRYFPERFRTLPAPASAQSGSFATLNDLHFGETRIGGQLTDDHEYGDAAPGFPVITDDEYEMPYAEFMNADAVADINQLDVDTTIIKGDIADAGEIAQFEAAARTFAGFSKPHHAFLGNHDHLQHHSGSPVDGYALLDQSPAPRAIELGGWALILIDTTIPGEHHGAFGAERREWLADTLALARAANTPTLILSHHQPVPPEQRHSYPNLIGLDPDDSLALFALLAEAPNVKGMLIGHTHRNRVRRYPQTGALPFAEVVNPKDYPGGFGHYRLFEDGSFRQEVRRISSERALHHSTRCRGLFDGGYQHFVMGTLDERCFVS